MILPNYKNYRPILESFLHLGKEALIVCKGDPARCVPVEEIGKFCLCRQTNSNIRVYGVQYIKSRLVFSLILFPWLAAEP